MKALIILTLTFLSISSGFAANSYGEDEKGQCTKGQGSNRGQEEVVVDPSSTVAAEESTQGK